MTEQTAKTIQLKGEQWKQLAILNVAQLQNFLQSIPGNIESGASGLTDGQIALVEDHIAEMATILRAWRVSKGPVVQPQQPAETVVQTNGAAEPAKAKGGWPKGKPRTRQAKAPAVNQ